DEHGSLTVRAVDDIGIVAIEQLNVPEPSPHEVDHVWQSLPSTSKLPCTVWRPFLVLHGGVGGTPSLMSDDEERPSSVHGNGVLALQSRPRLFVRLNASGGCSDAAASKFIVVAVADDREHVEDVR